MKNIHNAIVNVAPEKIKQFESELKDFTIEYIDVNKWICKVKPDKRFIKLSRLVVEIQWAAAYSYIMLYTKVTPGIKPSTKKIVSLTEDAEVAKAMKLLKWAYENMIINGKNSPWPSDLPQPIENNFNNQSMEKIADEMCLVAIASIIHHELAHIRLGHTSNSSIEEEKYADYEMADWILNHNLDINDMHFIKRSLGIAIAFETAIAYGIYTKQYGGTSHPPSYDRLINTLRPYIMDDNHVVWSVIAVSTKLHIDHRKLLTPDIEYNTFYECINQYADILSRAENSDSENQIFIL